MGLHRLPGLATIVFGLSETASYGGLSSPTAFLPILGGLALVAAFVYHAQHTSVRPLLDLTLFRAPGFAAAAAVVFLIGAALLAVVLQDQIKVRGPAPGAAAPEPPGAAQAA